MVTFYRARENVNKEKFMYDRIRESGAKGTLVIVPDQYTLVAEKQALKYLETECLFDVGIKTMNHIGNHLLAEAGEDGKKIVDKYGRAMLLSHILSEKDKELKVFRGAYRKRSYIKYINDFIDEAKQLDFTPEKLAALAQDKGADDLLSKKLEDLSLILFEYGKALEGKYLDIDDYTNLYNSCIASSSYFDGKEIWVYGFDNFSRKFITTLTEIAAKGVPVNIVLTDSDFGLSDMTEKEIARALAERDIEAETEDLNLFCATAEGSRYIAERPADLALLERRLFSTNYEREEKAAAPESIRLAECSNPYSEAEVAASHIYQLMRDEHYSPSDIAVVCNDEGKGKNIIKRCFREYGIPVFFDEKSRISDMPIASFVMGQLSFITNGYRSADILSMIKSGLLSRRISGAKENLSLSDGIIEKFELYVEKYGINGNMWKREFEYGADEYIEAPRKTLMDKISKLEELADGCGTMGDLAKGYYRYLEDEWDMSGRISRAANDLLGEDLPEEAARMIQSYNGVVSVLEQIDAIIGDNEKNLKLFAEFVFDGIMATEAAIIPPSPDMITFGASFRTRTAPVKALIIMRANDGLLPRTAEQDPLFSPENRKFFEERDLTLGSMDRIKSLEEEMATYRILTKAEEKLFVSWAISDEAGEDRKEAQIVEDMIGLFEECDAPLEPESDFIGSGFSKEMINSRKEAMRHYFGHRRYPEAGAELLTAVKKRFAEEGGDGISEMTRLDEISKRDNDPAPLENALAKRLYGKNGEFTFSVTSLQTQKGCPFKHFVQYGLKPKDDRKFESDSLRVGNVYHAFLQRIADEYIESKAEGTEGKFDDDEFTAGRVSDTMKDIAETCEEGLYTSNVKEKYRAERIQEMCTEIFAELRSQLSNPDLEVSCFEESFGYDSDKSFEKAPAFPPIEIKVGDETVFIHGKIDRVDKFKGNICRVIDYKSGKDEIDIEKMKSGYKMQLMVYMKSLESDGMIPGGIYYMHLNKPVKPVKLGDSRGSAVIALNNAFKLRGISVKEDDGTRRTPQEDNREKRKSSKDKDVYFDEQFDQLKEAVTRSIEELCRQIVCGEIDIKPLREEGNNGRAECGICDYKPICKFDRTYRGNTYRYQKKGNSDSDTEQ